MTPRTKNFHPDTDPRLLCTCGAEYCDRRSVKQWVLDRLQRVRDDYGKPISIRSGGRCSYHPAEVDKNAPGDHQKQEAVDIPYGSVLERNKLLVLAGRYGATRVAVGATFIHLAWSSTHDRSVPTWTYGSPK